MKHRTPNVLLNKLDGDSKEKGTTWIFFYYNVMSRFLKTVLVIHLV